MLIHEELTEGIIGAAIEVHRHLGPGLLEAVYEKCLCQELSLCGMPFDRQVHLPVFYKGVELDCGFQIDVLVDKKVVVELKAVHEIIPIHKAQLLTYLKLSAHRVGLLINFNVAVLKNGIERIVL